MKQLFRSSVVATASAVVLLSWLHACALFPATTFTEKYATGVKTLQAALVTTDQLLTAGKLSKADARNVEKQIDNAKEALDLAQQIYATDQTTGGNKLTSALAALQAISSYLATKQGI